MKHKYYDLAKAILNRWDNNHWIGWDNEEHDWDAKTDEWIPSEKCINKLAKFIEDNMP